MPTVKEQPPTITIRFRALRDVPSLSLRKEEEVHYTFGSGPDQSGLLKKLGKLIRSGAITMVQPTRELLDEFEAFAEYHIARLDERIEKLRA